MDIRPIRNRNKDNPYHLFSDEDNNIYIVTITNENGEIRVSVTKELFELLDELEKDEAKIIQQDKRHLIQALKYTISEDNEQLEQDEILEIILYRKAKEKPISLEDKVMKKIENEKLNQAINSLSEKQRRRILLYFKHNLSLSQIAKIEGCNKMAVKFSIDKALEELRKKFFEKK